MLKKMLPHSFRLTSRVSASRLTLLGAVHLSAHLCLYTPVLINPAVAQSAMATRTVEYQVINTILRFRTRHGIGSLKRHAAASDVARTHAVDMQENGFFSLVSPDKGSLNTQLQYARISARPLHTFVALGKDARAVFSQIKNLPALKDETANQIAVGLSQGNHPQLGQVYWATIVLMDSVVTIDNLPREVDVKQRIVVPVSVRAPYRNPRLPVTAPSGQVNQLRPFKREANKAYFQVSFREKGRYVLEVLVDKPGQGPRVACILPVYAGQSYPKNAPEETAAHQAYATPRQAESALLDKLNQARKKAALPMLIPDAKLAQAARLHSQDMASRQFFAHVNPEGLNPNARYQNIGGFGHVGENIVIENNLQNAHRQLMASPGHRANILDRDTTHVGIGIDIKDQRYYITQLFQHREPPHDLLKLREQIQGWLDSYRAEQKQPLLLQDTLLQGLTDTYAENMARTDQLDYQGVKQLSQQYLEQGGSYQHMTTLVLSGRNFKDMIARLKKHEDVLNQPHWERYGLGLSQSNSVQQGENTLWLTLGLAAD